MTAAQSRGWSADDIFDAWHALFPEADDHDVALLVAWLDEFRNLDQ